MIVNALAYVISKKTKKKKGKEKERNKILKCGRSHDDKRERWQVSTLYNSNRVERAENMIQPPTNHPADILGPDVNNSVTNG